MSLDQTTEHPATKPVRRMTGAQRREEILLAARTVFAERGYAASTDEVARAAGVSQPYVVRLFGTKRELFLEAYKQASAEIIAALSSVPAGPEALPSIRRSGSWTAPGGRSRPDRCGARPTWCRRPG